VFSRPAAPKEVEVRLLWSLPKATPAILRHLLGYAELVADDLDQCYRELRARLIASIIFGAALFFLVFIACLAVVALTWDTPHRVTAIGWMGGTFLVVALIAGLYRSKTIGAQTPFLGSVRREWAQDRIILERILTDQD